ncbi:MAG: DUF3037 domain-containing protein [Candidatus Promineifilaceae bacterium]
MTKTLFEYTVLRYVHDPMTQEFLNIGVVVYSATESILLGKLNHLYGRLSDAFTSLNARQHGRLIRSIDRQISTVHRKLQQSTGLLPTNNRPLSMLLPDIFPDDDSSIQFSQIGAGLTKNLKKQLDFLFTRMVMRYAEKDTQPTRNNDDVWRLSYRNAFRSANVLDKMYPLEISPYPNSRPYTFDRAWRNEVHRPYEALSFDLVQKDSIRNKAELWIARAKKFENNEEMGFITLLLGAPRRDALIDEYNYARDDLLALTKNVAIVEEDKAESFALTVVEEMRQHGIMT